MGEVKDYIVMCIFTTEIKNENFWKDETLKVQCHCTEEVFLEQVVYGRMRRGVCSFASYSEGCMANTAQVSKILNARRFATRSSCNGDVRGTAESHIAI